MSANPYTTSKRGKAAPWRKGLSVGQDPPCSMFSPESGPSNRERALRRGKHSFFELQGEAKCNYHDLEDLDEATDRFQDEYTGTHEDFEGWAEDYADNTGMLAEVPEHLRRYFDFAAFARDAELNGDIYGIELGNGQIAVFYDGR